MFDAVLINNRGEIACRVIRTCRRLGLRTIAVYSDADAGAAHVAAADEAYRLGPAAPSESYLAVERVLEVAKRTGAAVHPGYGFLSENAGFAEAVTAAGLVWIGPPPAAIRAMGSKAESKRMMSEAGVPLVPGYHGEAQDDATLIAEGERVGFPLLVKASAGGGGKGMRRVDEAAKLPAAIDAARREARAAFGDDKLLLERYVETPRHIELQVFGDIHGNVVHLFERECSIQRRYQKVIEEAPSPALDPERRQAMGEAAVAAARAVDYVGAGTVEFIVGADGGFYFLEMNTRLQVEHPVTELITGVDLVEWQLRVARGEALPLTQDELAIDGHALELRFYAEDPRGDYRPQVGRLETLVYGDGVRVDTGVREGDEVQIHYDPMLAKLISHGATREAAIGTMVGALEQTRVSGVVTNIELLSAVLLHPTFRAGELDTGFLDRHHDALLPELAADPRLLAVAALDQLERERAQARALAVAGDAHSPWSHAGPWLLNQPATRTLVFAAGETELELTLTQVADGWSINREGAEPLVASLRSGRLVCEGGSWPARVDGLGAAREVVLGSARLRLRWVDRLGGGADAEGAGGDRVSAPMPAKVTMVPVAVGDAVTAGQPLVVVEAMKMEQTLTSPRDGVVAEVRCAVGDQVDEGALLVALEEEA